MGQQGQIQQDLRFCPHDDDDEMSWMLGLEIQAGLAQGLSEMKSIGFSQLPVMQSFPTSCAGWHQVYRIPHQGVYCLAHFHRLGVVRVYRPLVQVPTS
jgi:hypothetical protein